MNVRTLAREREDIEIALAGEDDGEEAAVGRDGEFAEREAVEDWLRRGLRGRGFPCRGLRGGAEE